MPRLQQFIVSDEIRRVVEQAVKDGSLFRPRESALKILLASPECGLSAEQIEDRLTTAAIRANIPIEFGSRKISPPAEDA